MGEATIRRPLISGHCSNMGFVSENGRAAHARCAGAQRANPEKVFQPCPCKCHYPDAGEAELFECGECGKVIIEATRWPLDVDGDPRYTHMDWVINDAGEVIGGSGRALGEECYTAAPVSRNVMTGDTVRDCTRCGDDFTPKGRERICPGCREAEQAEKDAEVDDVLAELNEVLGDDEEFDAMLAEFDDLDEDD